MLFPSPVPPHDGRTSAIGWPRTYTCYWLAVFKANVMVCSPNYTARRTYLLRFCFFIHLSCSIEILFQTRQGHHRCDFKPSSTARQMYTCYWLMVFKANVMVFIPNSTAHRTYLLRFCFLYTNDTRHVSFDIEIFVDSSQDHCSLWFQTQFHRAKNVHRILATVLVFQATVWAFF